MSLLVVGVLCLLWLVFFLPSYLQSRPTSSPYQQAAAFQESLRRLGEPTTPVPPTTRRPARQAAARRRDMLTGLSGMVLAAGVVGVYLGGWAMWAPAVPGAVMLGYLVALRVEVARRRQARRAGHARPRTSQARSAAPAPAVRESDIVLSVHRRAAAEPPPDDAFERLAG